MSHKTQENHTHTHRQEERESTHREKHKRDPHGDNVPILADQLSNC